MQKRQTHFVVITGVSRGLGRAMTAQFIQRGWAVAGCGRAKDRLKELGAQYGPPHSFQVVEVTDGKAVQDWARGLLQNRGAPDLLLNNAAVINANNPLWCVSEAEFSAVIDVNLKGVANVIRAFVPAMIARKKGVIVNFSSGWGRATDAEVAPYCATKWGIEGLTRALAQELPPDLAAVPLNPGIINTEMLQSCFGDSAAAYPSAEQWAKTAVPFLISLGRQHNGEPVSVPSANGEW